MNILKILIFTMAFHLAGAAQPTPTAPAVQSIVIRAGTLIDGKSNSARHNQVIIIRGNRIESVFDASAAKCRLGPK